MSMTEPEINLEAPENQDKTVPVSQVRHLAEKAKLADAATAEALAAKRELALLKAGVDTESGPGKLFAKAYDGEMTVEAVKAAAEEYGVLAPQATEASTDEVAAGQRIAAASQGAPPPAGTQTLEDAIDGAKNEKELKAVLATAGMLPEIL